MTETNENLLLLNLVNMGVMEEPPILTNFAWICWAAVVENEDVYIFYNSIWINLTFICFISFLVNVITFQTPEYNHN